MVGLIQHLIAHPLRLKGLLLDQQLFLFFLLKIVGVNFFNPSRKILLLLQLLFFLLPLFLNLLFKCLLYLLLFLKVLFFFFCPDLLVKYFLVFDDFTPFVR